MFNVILISIIIMMKDDYLCIEEVEKTVHIALSPAYVGSKVSGVIEVLESWKRQYIQQLSGVVVNFKNVSLSSGLGSIITDQLFIHYDVKATFSIFKPCVGNILRGTINRISKEHVGCVVHDVINVSIRLSEDMADNISKYIVLDNVIYFKVTNVDFHRRLIRVKGRITMDCVELLEKYSLTNAVTNKRVVYDTPLSGKKTLPETSVKDNFYTSRKSVISMDVNEPGDSDDESNSLVVPKKSKVQTYDSKNTLSDYKKTKISSSISASENNDISQEDSGNEEYTNVNEAALKTEKNTESDTDSSDLTDNEGDVKIKKELNHISSPHKHKKKLKLDKNKGEDSHKKHKKKSKEKKKIGENSGSKSSPHKKSKKSSKKLVKSKDDMSSKDMEESVENKSFIKSIESPDKKSKESTGNKKSHKKKKKSGDDKSPEKKVKSIEKDKNKDSDKKKSKKRKLKSTKDTSDSPSKKIKLEPD